MQCLLLGNEAVAFGARDAGVTVASAYPGTPSTEITETIAKFDEVYSEWAPNEKVAVETAIGASFAGARAICAMKHVGLNVAADPLFTVSYTGVNGGLCIVVADDPGMHSSQNEQDSRFYARSAHILMLEPSDSQECYDFTRLAFELSERFDTPVLLRLTTRVAHARSVVALREKEQYLLKDYKKDMAKYVMVPANAIARHVVVEKRDALLREYAETAPLNRVERGQGKACVVSSGISYQYVKEAFPDADVLKLGVVYPLPEKLLKDFAAQAKKLIVAEELEPYIETHCRAIGIETLGKERLTLQGELTPAMLRERFADILPAGEAPQAVSAVTAEPAPPRPPALCAGCPHRGAFYVLGKLKLHVMGDIGCYTLGAMPPSSAIDACVCMGASIGMVHGMDKARGAQFAAKTVAVLGDSTFIHSGITGLIDIVYNKGVSTVIILDNSITGMTGHQQNPATGITIKGEKTRQIDLKKLCEAVGVERVRVCDPFDLKDFEKVVLEETAAAEPSVIIAQRPCILLKGVRRAAPCYIDREKCKKCMSCLRLGCPAIVRKPEGPSINESMCVGCGLCARLCAFGAICGRGE